ncbi:flagellar hook-associated protein FlgK [Dasania sp. GY-MA-18]|uniref:Flagellar hook-associated protein 1 n=1 Tax=Dasania phycosphaerae TaxID=2950436 RepID=A0A9J6RH85_9GAMM|nr:MULTISPECIES: flagellar hook-associated protein FlgK [Dasania]MCR8921392.1 flagellar hook-associated protein FlgK [Dasania sp. GY-MA-18]MCZ0863820.1 flagellar hook-associated protein FlgK [Dasania phycosphaerae]MCZ0867548.1 flagellar hook-associated protein FlgK [Dasania phycosphaerae]
MSSLLSIGVSGLSTNQTSLQVTGNNIANADVEGYSRQRAEVETRPEFFQGVGFIGSGAGVSDISRIVENFLITQLQSDTASFNNLAAYVSSIEEMDVLLADSFSGLSPALDSVFSDIEAGAQDPTSMPARQLVLSDLEGLVERFNTLYQRIQRQQESINQQTKAFTSQVSSLAEGIANLNVSITEEMARGKGQPNQLLDERDRLITQLSELVTVRTAAEDNGALSVFIGSGQALVLGGNHNELVTANSVRNPGQLEINISGLGGTQQITRLINGGKLGGLVAYQQDALPSIYNSLGRISLGIAETMNQQNKLGIDLEGNFGDDIFRDINSSALTLSRVIADVGNTGAATLSVSISDVNQLTTSDYFVDFSGTGSTYQIVRESDNAVVSSGTIGAFPATINVDGFDLDISSSPNAGDKFYLNPTKTAAQDIALEITRPQEFAYASPIVTGSSLGNTGTGIISGGTVLSVAGAAMTDITTPVKFVFTSATSYDVINSSTNAVISAGNAFVPNTVNIYTSPNAAYSIELTGAPATGDEFTVDYNVDGISDNRNGVALGNLRLASSLDNGTLNFEDAYGRLLEELGAKTAQLRISRDASESLLIQSQKSRDSVSGVNLDEEAANLIKFEQAYNASARIITVAQQIFDTLLAAFR